jgi:predicted aconitase
LLGASHGVSTEACDRALATSLWPECADAFFPVLGYVCGLKSEACVPVVVGLEEHSVSQDDLKAFSAAFGSTASVAMFHMAGITPEAPDAATALAEKPPTAYIELNMEDFVSAWSALDSGKPCPSAQATKPDPVQLVAFGIFDHLYCAALRSVCAGTRTCCSVCALWTPVSLH